MTRALAPLVALAVGCGWFPPAEPEEPAGPSVQERTFLSDAYHIDQRYASMLGPWSTEHVTLLDAEAPELLWITGYRTEVIDAHTGEELGQEFMCHANLDLEIEQYLEDFDMQFGLSGRVFTLSQGQHVIEFPEGHGIPVLSNRPLQLTTQVLNLNDDDIDLDVRHRVTVQYLRDQDLEEPIRPMFQGAVQGFKAIEDSGLHYGVTDADPEDHGPGCEVGFPALEGDYDIDAHGQKFTAHWVVPPGREETRTLVTEFLNLPFDTTVHYIAVHLHPFAESLELIDRTKGETVFKSEVRPAEGRIGIEHVDYFTSEEGVKVYADHDYELVAIYDNPLDEAVDSMAVMYLYLHDKQFRKPDLTQVAHRSEEAPAEELPSGM